MRSRVTRFVLINDLLFEADKMLWKLSLNQRFFFILSVFGFRTLRFSLRSSRRWILPLVHEMYRYVSFESSQFLKFSWHNNVGIRTSRQCEYSKWEHKRLSNLTMNFVKVLVVTYSGHYNETNEFLHSSFVNFET